MSNKDFNLAVVIMRAQLPTEAHFKLIEEAHKKGDHVLVLLGSANKAPQVSNPFSYDKRRRMLQFGLNPQDQFKTTFFALKDFDHMEHEWEIEVNRLVTKALLSHLERGVKGKVTLVIHEKDDSTYYSKSFPSMVTTKVPSFGNYNATDLREILFSQGDTIEKKLELISKHTRPNVVKHMALYAADIEDKFGYEYMLRQHAMIKEAKRPYLELPYGIKFNTSDALVICGNSVLLVQRGDGMYGENLWALPGGYINQGEVFDKALYRELFEETTIDVPERALRNAYKGKLEFEGAKRDERGDFTTKCGIFVIEPNKDGSLPKVKGNDDAKDAKWFTFEKVNAMKSYTFLDHAGIIEVCRRYVMVRNHFVSAM